MLVQKVRKIQRIENTQALLLCMVYVSKVRLSQFEWKSRDSPTETRLTDRYRSTDSLSFVTPTNFPHAMTVRPGGWPMTSHIQCMRRCQSITCTIYTHTHPHTHTHSTFKAEEARKLRVAVGSFLDLLTLVIDTIREFGTHTST